VKKLSTFSQMAQNTRNGHMEEEGRGKRLIHTCNFWFDKFFTWNL